MGSDEMHKSKTAKPEIGFRLFENSAYLRLELKPSYVFFRKSERITLILDIDVKIGCFTNNKTFRTHTYRLHIHHFEDSSPEYALLHEMRW